MKVPIDILIVNPAVEGAAAFSADLRRRHAQLKIVALLPEGENKLEIEGVRADATRPKPNISGIAGFADEPTAESEWVQFIQQVAGNRTAGGRAN